MFTNKLQIILFSFIFLNCTLLYSQIAVNIDNSIPDNSAMLDVQSANKGLLVPRMTAVQRDAIANPSSGLLIFCSEDNNLYYNSGTQTNPVWSRFNEQWVDNGSGLTFNMGSVGIGTIKQPAAKLDVNGNIAINGIPVINAIGQWVGSQTSYVGPQGSTGIQGIKGPTGVIGPQGVKGISGNQGIQGEPAGTLSLCTRVQYIDDNALSVCQNYVCSHGVTVAGKNSCTATSDNGSCSYTNMGNTYYCCVCLQ